MHAKVTSCLRLVKIITLKTFILLRQKVPSNLHQISKSGFLNINSKDSDARGWYKETVIKMTLSEKDYIETLHLSTCTSKRMVTVTYIMAQVQGPAFSPDLGLLPV